MMNEYKRKDLHEENTEKNRKAPLRISIIFVLLIVLCIAIVAAGGGYLLQPRSQEHEGTLAPDFSLTDLDGNTFRLSDFKGKVVIISFMATWCGTCRQEMPNLKVIWENEAYRDKIVLISIDVDTTRSEEALEAFREEFSYATWIWAKDTVDEKVAQSYQVISLPTTVIIDQNGYTRFTHTGATDASTFIEEIDQLLG